MAKRSIGYLVAILFTQPSVMAFAMMVFAAMAFASDHSPAVKANPYSLPRTQTLTLTSSINHKTYHLYVQLPRKYSDTDADNTYPLILLQDSNFSFPTAVGAMTLMAGNDVDEAIIVGMSYADGDSPQLSRTRDYTPTHAPNEATAHSEAAQKNSGGAANYIRLLEEEALPLLQKHFRVDKQRRVFVGHSFGGLLGAYVLLVKPDLFQHYILGSPSLWYDNFALFALEKEYAQGHKDMPAKVHFFIGGEEYRNHHPSMIDDLKRYAKQLESRHYRGLEVDVRVVDGQSHTSVFPFAFSFGIVAALGTNADTL